ncbi:MAG: hypothetical protein AAF725_08590 [Acidobacteriota bacterium]
MFSSSTAGRQNHIAPRRRLAAASALLFTLFAGSSLRAGDDLVIFPEAHTGSPPNAPISVAALLENDGDSGAIAGFTPASRGVLSLQGLHFIYVPGPDFYSAGLDRFTYWTEEDPAAQTVTLMRGLTRSLSTDGFATLSSGQCAWNHVTEPTSSGVSLISDPVDGCMARFDAALSVESIILNDDLGNPGPAGGHTEMILDGGNIPPLELAVPNLYMVATENGSERFGLFETSEGLVLRATEVDSTVVQSAATEKPALRTKIGLTWWFESQPGVRDGGLALEIDGALKLRLEGLQLGAFSENLRWSFGPGGEGGVLLGRARVFTSDRTPTFQPIYSNYGRTDDWSKRVNPAMVALEGSADPYWRLSVPPAPSTVQLVDDRVLGSNQYNVRFEVGLDSLSLPDWQWVNLLRSTTSRGRQDPFRVQLRRHPVDGFQVRGLARSGNLSESTPWVPIRLTGADDRPVIELRWRTSLGRAPSSHTGYLLLRVDGGDPAIVNQLHNGLADVNSVSVGLGGPPIGSSGSLVIDSFDSWR